MQNADKHWAGFIFIDSSQHYTDTSKVTMYRLYTGWATTKHGILSGRSLMQETSTFKEASQTKFCIPDLASLNRVSEESKGLSLQKPQVSRYR